LLISSAKPPGTLGRFSTGLKSEWEFNIPLNSWFAPNGRPVYLVAGITQNIS
jgi:hypothetical protein